MSTHTFRSVGSVRSIRKRSDGWDFVCEGGLVRLSWLRDGVIRVRATPAGDFGPDFSYAIARRDWPRVNWSAKRVGRRWEWKTRRLTVVIETDPLRLEFRSADGTLLNRDERERGMGFEGPKCRTHRELAAGEMFFGCGEKSGQFNKRGEVFANWNTDNPSHTYLNGELYVSIPFLISVRWEGGQPHCYGLFFDNSHRTVFNLGRVPDEGHYVLEAEGGELDYYFFAGPTLPEVVRDYTELTGRMWMPPRWALGYHQCRWSYMSADEVLEVAQRLRKAEIPADVIYCDIDYMDGYRVFTWNPKTFPKPREFIQKLSKLGFKLVTIIDPGVKNDDEYFVCREGKAKDMFVRRPNGEWFTGKVWPGECVFPDFTSPRVRAWWGELHREFVEMGVAGFWNDMNEPAVWDPQSAGTMPLDLPHEYDGLWATHRRAHNVYGLNMARACHEGWRRLRPNERPFIITRSAYAGVQRYAMVWTGDNHSAWEQLELSIRQCLNLSLSGMPFCGPDVGGFSWDCTGELLVRWTQAGAFFPFFRNHTAWGTRRQEPYAFGPEVERLCREAIRGRYALLPYLYTLFFDAVQNGTPIIRPLFWEFPKDPHGYAIDDEFLLGPSLLVAPILKQGQRQRAVYLPAGSDWYDYRTRTRHAGGQFVTATAPLEFIPVFVRAGTILPTCAPKPFMDAKPWREIELEIFPGPKTTGWLYEDDGHSFDYEQGRYCLTRLRWENGELRADRVKEGFASPARLRVKS